MSYSSSGIAAVKYLVPLYKHLAILFATAGCLHHMFFPVLNPLPHADSRDSKIVIQYRYDGFCPFFIELFPSSSSAAHRIYSVRFLSVCCTNAISFYLLWSSQNKCPYLLLKHKDVAAIQYGDTETYKSVFRTEVYPCAAV